MPTLPYIVDGTICTENDRAVECSKLFLTTSQGKVTLITDSDGKIFYDLGNVGYTAGETVTWTACDEYNNEINSGSFEVTGASKTLNITLSHREDNVIVRGNRDSQISNIGGNPVHIRNPFPSMMVGHDGADYEALRLDRSTRTLQTMTYPHHEVHSGNGFGCIGVNDLANNAVLDLQLTTPNTTKWIHLTISYDTEVETQFFLYENVTILLAGTVALPVNHNRNSSTTSGLGIGIITNTSVANANLDTAVASATILAQSISGAGRNGGTDRHAHEWILKQNKVYSIRFVANAAGYTDYHLSWYEHEDK